MLRGPLPTRDLDELRAYAYCLASNLVVDHWRTHRRKGADGQLPIDLPPIATWRCAWTSAASSVG
jgi:DNA-directed RNA polymerase specialized sigma24 family protein